MKIIRDKLAMDGHPDYNIIVAPRTEIASLLKHKLIEEAFEVMRVPPIHDPIDRQHLIEEIADVQEVLNQLMIQHMMSKDEVEKVRMDKRERRGGFEQGYCLL